MVLSIMLVRCLSCCLLPINHASRDKHKSQNSPLSQRTQQHSDTVSHHTSITSLARPLQVTSLQICAITVTSQQYLNRVQHVRRRRLSPSPLALAAHAGVPWCCVMSMSGLAAGGRGRGEHERTRECPNESCAHW